MSFSERYFNEVMRRLEDARKTNSRVIADVAPLIGQSVARGGVLHVFGSGHSEVIAREIIGRAGGLACVSGILDPTNGFIENLVGYGAALVARHDRQYQMLPGETIIVISNSGKNVSPIEVALYAKEKGLHVVGLLSLPMSQGTATAHPGGRRLHEIADFILDNGGVPGDTLIDVRPEQLSGQPSKTAAGSTPLLSGPTSTVIGAMLLNLLMLGVIEWLQANGHTPPLLRSQNLPGAIEYNRAVGKPYLHRLSRQLA
ncbi:MAG: sugar isomerase domain-containing protein [Opitutaceae bacterium]|nr:sugar isomerase domain-containing protein [Opitutaceae bacterium]